MKTILIFYLIGVLVNFLGNLPELISTIKNKRKFSPRGTTNVILFILTSWVGLAAFFLYGRFTNEF